jgi:putative cell wall-binding protein
MRGLHDRRGGLRVMRHWGRRLLAASVVTLLAVTGLVAIQSTIAPVPQASAANAADFDPGDIISDAVFYNSGTMSVASIQAFLNSKVPNCTTGYTCLKDFRQSTFSRAADSQCAAYAGANNESAASIIYKVSTACGINPQVIVTTLQKEQGLVTNVYPSGWRYDTAMGYACPDTPAGCDAKYYGFYNQVYMAAWQFKVYQRYPTSFNYVAGNWKAIQYTPYNNCGAPSVYIRNQATAGLYNYTPYQPNAAALKNLYGVGDSCSSYGNRNFWVYFTDWFGSTHYTTAAQLSALWTQTGGATGTLGNPTSRSLTYASGGVGQAFEHGWAYWSSATGAFMTSGKVGQSYATLLGPTGVLGYPTAAQRTEPLGAVSQRFQLGALYTTPLGTIHRVANILLGPYLTEGGPAGWLGFPTDSTNSAPNGGYVEPFDNGRIYRTGETGPVAIPAAIVKAYDAAGGPGGKLGYPIVAMSTAKDGTNTVQFENGDIAWSSSKAPAVTMTAPRVVRISGSDRYATAVAVSRSAFPSTAPVVWVATGELYPDALAAAPAAVKQGGPLLLTTPTSLPAAVGAEIERLKPGKIVVVGGTGAVSNAVFAQLNAIAPSVRLGGSSRMETALNVVKYAFTSAPAVYFATGLDYPDALSASAAAGATGSPVVLVDGGLATLPTATASLVSSLHPAKAYILGGTAVVSPGIQAGVARLAPATRFAGIDRFATNQLVNRAVLPTAAQAFLATGTDFPDALTGAALSGSRSAPMYLNPQSCIPRTVWIGMRLSGVKTVSLVGGTGVLGAGVAALKRCG